MYPFHVYLGVLAHLAEVKELMEKASNLVGAERLKLELLGPKQELDVLRPIFEPRGAKFYEMDQETLVNFKQTKQTKDDHVTIVPYMKVKEGQMEKYRKIIDEFYEKTRQGKANCLYYEYCTNGNTILCREGYKTGEDLLQHFADVAQPYQKAKNLAEFDISIVGPKSELDKIRKDPNVDPVKFYELDEGAMIAIE